MPIKSFMFMTVCTLLLTGCAKQPLLPPMEPVKLDSKSVNNLKKEEVQSFISKIMNDTVKGWNGAQYLNDPKHVAISIKGERQGTHDDRYVLWQKYSYSYAYGYYYDDVKKEILEVPAHACVDSYLSGTTGKVNVTNWDCEDLKVFYPGDDFKKTIISFRLYLSTDVPKLLSDYNMKKSK